MKKFVKFGLVLGMLVATLGAYAANITISVGKENEKSINILIDEAKEASLVLINEQGASVYSETVGAKKGIINRTYDLKFLPAGKYTLKAETATKVVSYSLDLTAVGTTIIEDAVKEVFKPVLFTKDGRAMLQLLNLNESPVNVTIYDTNNNVLYQQEFTGELNFTKQFSLKKAFSSSYTFVISIDDTTFTEEISL